MGLSGFSKPQSYNLWKAFFRSGFTNTMLHVELSVFMAMRFWKMSIMIVDKVGNSLFEKHQKHYTASYWQAFRPDQWVNGRWQKLMMLYYHSTNSSLGDLLYNHLLKGDNIQLNWITTHVIGGNQWTRSDDANGNRTAALAVATSQPLSSQVTLITKHMWSNNGQRCRSHGYVMFFNGWLIDQQLWNSNGRSEMLLCCQPLHPLKAIMNRSIKLS